MNKMTVSVALALTALVAGCAQPDNTRDVGDASVSGKVLAQQVCSMCHGVDGNSVNPTFPKLAGQQKEYLVDELKEFRAQNRSDPAGTQYMWGISRHLTDNQINELADYFAAQKRTPDANDHPSLAELGQQIFDKGSEVKQVPACASCHGADGHGHGIFPYIAGQHADYIVKQLNIFKETEKRPDGAMMKGETHDLTPEEMKAVAAYVSTMS